MLFSLSVICSNFRACVFGTLKMIEASVDFLNPMEVKMAKKLYIGNLSYSVDDERLHQHFSQCGQVDSAKVITDRETGRSKGFGFVEMSSDDEANAAIDKLNGQELDGRSINVSEARPQAPREGGGGRGGPRGFGGGGRGGPRRDGGGFRGSRDGGRG